MDLTTIVKELKELIEEDCVLVPHPKRHRGRPTLGDYAIEKASIAKSKKKTRRTTRETREPVKS